MPSIAAITSRASSVKTVPERALFSRKVWFPAATALSVGVGVGVKNAVIVRTEPSDVVAKTDVTTGKSTVGVGIFRLEVTKCEADVDVNDDDDDDDVVVEEEAEEEAEGEVEDEEDLWAERHQLGIER